MENRKAIYAGSFDPFTIGHLDIIKQSYSLFNKMYVVVANNPNKKRNYPVDLMIEAINNTLKEENINNVVVLKNDGLIAKLAKEKEVSYLIRGLRDTTDYLYEENIAKINKLINKNLKTIYFRATMDTMSSSLIRELIKYNEDVSEFVSSSVLDVINKVSKEQ